MTILSIKISTQNPKALRSRCPHCGHVLRWHENIPLLGWLRLGGRCAACRAPIGLRYPLLDPVLGDAPFAAIGVRFGPEPATLLWCGFAAVLLAAIVHRFL